LLNPSWDASQWHNITKLKKKKKKKKGKKRAGKKKTGSGEFGAYFKNFYYGFLNSCSSKGVLPSQGRV
jgi:hypothetical protein